MITARTPTSFLRKWPRVRRHMRGPQTKTETLETEGCLTTGEAGIATAYLSMSYRCRPGWIVERKTPSCEFHAPTRLHVGILTVTLRRTKL